MRVIGTFHSERWGTVTVTQAHYLFANGPIAIHLDGADGPLTKLSVNLATDRWTEKSVELPPDCFYVKTWEENEALAAEALASGLFLWRHDLPIASLVGSEVVAPVWQIRA